MEEDLELLNWDFERETTRLDEILDISEVFDTPNQYQDVNNIVCAKHDQLILTLI